MGGDHKAIDQFAKTACRLIDTLPVQVACSQIVTLLRPILLRHDLPIQDNDRRHVLFEKPGGLTILGHHFPKPDWSNPHDHGRTWAVYGQITGKTAMYEYERTSDSAVRLADSYWMMPGEARLYPRGAIHSHRTHGDTRLIRIEGLNIWRRENNTGGRIYRLEEAA